jgi:hypothetical protein
MSVRGRDRRLVSRDAGNGLSSPAPGTPPAAAPDPLVVERLGDGRWRVTGGAEPHVVELDLRSGALLCDCRGFKFRGRCRHVDGVARFEGGEAPTDPAPDAAAFVSNAGPGLERDVPLPQAEP